jgi:hypothetical protein
VRIVVGFPGARAAMSPFSQQLMYRGRKHEPSPSFVIQHGDSELGVNDMNPGWSPARERAATLPFDGQAASARLDARQTAKERRPSDNSTAASPLVRFLYWIYERRLLNSAQTAADAAPRWHILDGNRRHARKRGLSDPYEIDQRGAEKLDHILDWCANLRIPAVTLWVFSTENLKRSQAEVSGTLSAIEAKVAGLAHDPFVQRRHIRARAIGRLDILPEFLASTAAMRPGFHAHFTL